MSLPGIPVAIRRRYGPVARIVTIACGVIIAASAYLPWAYGSDALDNVTYVGGPSFIQFIALGMGLVLPALVVCSIRWPAGFGRTRVGWIRGARALATGLLIIFVVIAGAISVQLGGTININYGAWVGLAAALIGFVATRFLVQEGAPTVNRLKTPGWLSILAIAVVMLVMLFVAYYALDQSNPGTFVTFIVYTGVGVAVLLRTGALGWLTAATGAHRRVMLLAAFLVAFLFPFTQGGSDANMSIAAQVLVFAATAMGLNIVVGLAGLLDLGYIAFLGSGAFVAAMLSGTAMATFDVHPPFIVTMLLSGCVAATLGLVIGSPTLRVSGDYLAIITLAFGEIFRLSMNNLDGSDGPDLTHGSRGISDTGDLNLFGFDFGATHTIAGIEIGRFANYYFILLIWLAIVILIFSRLNNSRIGRGWVAIREDEKAAEAMGVNVFGLKLLAFASGAFLAGVAGSIKAHVDISVTPDSYVFLQSSFLLAAVVLGGMGTVLGVLIGATLLQLMPEKLRFVNEYRLMFFGLLLVVMMRFRPEGIIASERRQLEFHDEDEELAERLDDNLGPSTGAVAVEGASR
ncbi:branched-chain amino acid ABC transporter permease [Microlunatus endophyticus]|uniref:Branched-chain amino acid ABC transporter permease n=1 Tax=Microlunatus endophyticus TaxID=1716077 RepID=A0A917SF67_9ACTN|nr:branched-chain amino acid ABC transporter permease [Microlunatus endophyticus]GGL76248.1 branched-chain amino acid ABC transporter permease [Microlunatus endophyticus]